MPHVPEVARMLTADRMRGILRDAYGPQGWWSEDPYTVMFQSVLVQNTSWSSVMRVCDSMGVPDAGRVGSMTPAELEDAIRPCGFARTKAATVLGVTGWFMGYGCDPGRLSGIETGALRDQLLSIKGIGEETADVILLYALRRPVFVVDAYTRRLMSRLGLPSGDDRDIRAFFETGLSSEVDALGEMHRLILEHGIAHCGKSPRCDGCPLTGQCRFAGRSVIGGPSPS